MSRNDQAHRSALRWLYQDRDFQPRAWPDAADPAWIGISLLERSVALLAGELEGELLDVGCGQRPYAAYFSHVRRQRACDFDHRRGRVDFECPAHRIPLLDGVLDAILCTEVLEHTPDPQAVWREFHRLLKPGGRVLLTTPMYWPAHEEPHDYYRYPEHGLKWLAEAAGFDVLRMIPRGGSWAFLGQVLMHAVPQYLRWSWQRRWLNRFFLRLDAWRCNPGLTLGWTVLAVRRADVVASA